MGGKRLIPPLAGVVMARFLPGAMTPALVVLVAFLALNARFKWAPKVQRFAGAFFVVLGVASLVVRGVHGVALFDALSKKVSAFLTISDYGAHPDPTEAA